MLIDLTKFTFITFLLLACFCTPCCAEMPWSSNIQDLQQEDKSQPVLVYFTASWCGPCQMMKSKTFKSEILSSGWEGLALLMIDRDEYPDLAQAYDVQGIPCFLLIDRHREEVARRVGYCDAETFKQWIDEHRSDWLSDKNKQEKELALRTTWLNDLQNYGLQSQAWTSILDHIKKEKQVELCEKVLEQYWKAKPLALLESLRHPQLFFRILGTRQLLRQNIESFDPWAEADFREQALLELQKKGLL